MSATGPIQKPDPATGSLTCLMPGLNEEESIVSAVGRVVAALEQAVSEFEVIIINDGSTDRTGELADSLARADERIRVIHNPVNVNYGYALRRGIEEARCDWILHDGMDLPLWPEDVGLFTPHFAEADVIVACRADRSAHSPWRKLTSWTNNLLLRVLFQPRASDLNFTQFYRRSWAQSLRPLSTSPAFITPELILRAEHTGKDVRYVDVIFRKREAGKAHFGRLPDILWTLKDMLRLRLYTWRKGWAA